MYLELNQQREREEAEIKRKMRMQKQKSLSLKSRKFMLFTLSLTFLLSLLILSLLNFWVMQDTSFNSIHLETHFHLHKPSLDVLNLELENHNFDTLTLTNTLHRKPQSAQEKVQISECDVSIGRWVFDESYPLYTNFTCPFIDEGFNCNGNGRLDSDYMRWRWQPLECDIPRFNAKKMLEMIRGKRVVFVGDSINRNQWESMMCMLMAEVKDPKKVYETHGREIRKEKGNYSFRFVDNGCTIEYHVSHYLVHESKARVGHKRVQTLQIDNIDRGSSRWRNADILIFNSANWWTHSKTKDGINYFQEGNLVHPHLDVLIAFQQALTTWATWVDRHINPHQTQVFFRSSTPSHFRGGEWNTGGHCEEANNPLNEPHVSDPEKDLIAMEIIKKMKTPVTFLNVTTLSSYRQDGHPSVFGSKSKSKIQDCSHWCLPGVPDAWNELLYYDLLSQQANNNVHSS